MRPVNAKADMAKAKAMKEKAAKKQAAKIAADKAKSAAYKKSPAYLKKQKQKQIDSLRRKASEKKREKGEREAAEKQAAAEAAAAKRAALLQKIRVKKANEQIKIVEKPPGIFSGAGSNIQKKPGELETEFVKRKYADDIKKFHSEADRIESETMDTLDVLNKRRDSVDASVMAKEEELHAAFMGGLGDAKESVRLRGQLAELRKKQNEAYKDIRDAYVERDRRLHDLVGEFTEAHAAGKVSLDSTNIAGKFESPKSARAQGMEKKLEAAWNWFSRVAAPAHKDAFDTTTIEFRAGGGGSHSMENKKITIGTDVSDDSLLRTTVHEYGHAIESRRSATMNAVADDYMQRRSDFMAQERGAKILGIDGCKYYECVYKHHEKRQDLDLYAPSHLGYASRYSDCGYDEVTRKKYASNQTGRYKGGTEVYSTGVEYLYFQPSAFRKRAKHGFDITLLILSGRL